MHNWHVFLPGLIGILALFLAVISRPRQNKLALLTLAASIKKKAGQRTPELDKAIADACRPQMETESVTLADAIRQKVQRMRKK